MNMGGDENTNMKLSQPRLPEKSIRTSETRSSRGEAIKINSLYTVPDFGTRKCAVCASLSREDCFSEQ